MFNFKPNRQVYNSQCIGQLRNIFLIAGLLNLFHIRVFGLKNLAQGLNFFCMCKDSVMGSRFKVL